MVVGLPRDDFLNSWNFPQKAGLEAFEIYKTNKHPSTQGAGSGSVVADWRFQELRLLKTIEMLLRVDYLYTQELSGWLHGSK